MKIPTWEAYFSHRIIAHDDCLLWTGSKDYSGYGRCGVAFARHIHFAHRMSWFLANGPFDRRLRVLHRCDTPSCVNPAHLFLGTQADNVADMTAKGRNRSPQRFGEANPVSKLTEAQVREIRRMKDEGVCSQAEISRRFGVSPMTVSRAVRGQSWSHL
jgi:DNA-binding CsgD family transcriptional regulator